MSAFQFAGIVIVVIWGTTALMLAIVMGRRGYSSWGWGIIGAALGPIAVAVALLADIPQRSNQLFVEASGGAGPVDVLVGTDGSSRSRAAAIGVLDLIGDRLGRLTFVGVAPIDATVDEDRRVVRDVDEMADAFSARLSTGVIPGRELLHGKAADTLRRHAVEGGYDTIAIGSHGKGASSALLGSTAAALVRDSPVPLVITGIEALITQVPVSKPREAVA